MSNVMMFSKQPSPEPNFSLIDWEIIERVKSDADPEHFYFRSLRRAKVPGGWLVQARVEIRDAEHQTREFKDSPYASGIALGLGAGISVAYVPDPDYAWVLEHSREESRE